jgi:hypothetical protein
MFLVYIKVPGNVKRPNGAQERHMRSYLWIRLLHFWYAVASSLTTEKQLDRLGRDHTLAESADELRISLRAPQDVPKFASCEMNNRASI